MKNKNMVLLIVAMGCGLVAAVVTAKLSANNAPKQAAVLACAVDLKQSTQFTEDKLSEYLTSKPVIEEEFIAAAGDLLPADENGRKALIGMRLQRTLRKGEAIRRVDLTNQESFRIPPGKRGFALKVSAEQVAGGFVLPGSHVDVLAIDRTSGRPRAGLILQDMTVIAVDVVSARNDAVSSIPQPQTVTLAADAKESSYLALAMSRGELKLLLRTDGDVQVDSILAMYDSLPFDRATSGEAPKAPVIVEKEPETTDVVVALQDIKEGTELKDVEKLFEVKKYLKSTAPLNVFSKIEDLKDKQTKKPIYASLPVALATFEGVLPMQNNAPPPPPPPSDRIHTMLIRNGSSQNLAIFKNGAYQDPLAPAPAPPAPPKVEEAKDEKPKE
jgi:pilus assembly protein CpaB